HLKELRLNEGPLGHDEAVKRLLAWAEEQGIPAAAPADEDHQQPS
ncbi:MAG: hypothetical protein QOJ32_2627, partial [Frankiaceae bacterium]|nr:hypothetical protein [Frankiaceae bacterium]